MTVNFASISLYMLIYAFNIQAAGQEDTMTLTVLVSNCKGNADLAISSLRPHAATQDTRVGISQSGQARHSDATFHQRAVSATHCREHEERALK